MDPFRLVVDQRFGLDFIIIFNPRGPLKCLHVSGCMQLSDNGLFYPVSN